MMEDTCAEMRLLVQADVDGELMAADIAGVQAHLEHCPACSRLQGQLVAISERMRQEVTYHPIPAELGAAVRARLAPRMASHSGVSRQSRPALTRPWLAAPFSAGFALAACLALVFLLPRSAGLPDAVVADHIRALQPGHLMDVVSTDQHTVKPWFDGRLDFAPPVKDLKVQGFPLVGGRLDYLDGKNVAALIYQRRQHFIDVFVWPEGRQLDFAAGEGSQSGYNFLHWRQDGMVFWAVSDLASDELAGFVGLWRAG